ncbi:hypothetical protein F4811DRAFT_500671 [Daldinia bambusicola]|nr:hypothetical protein F4811DRAFT_500671 [Daldinia bambusicola]
MAKVFGIVAGAVGLASALETCINAIGCIQTGRHLGSDFQSFQLRLTILELRLSRWGEALQVNKDPRFNNPAAIDIQTRTAKDALVRILEVLEESDKLCQKSRPSSGRVGDRSGQDEERERCEQLLNRRITEMVARRKRNGANSMRITCWVLYNREHAVQLIGNITLLIGLLEHIYPMPEKEQELAREEARQLTSVIADQASTIRYLRQVLQGIDSYLKEAIDALNPHGHQYGNVSAEGNARIQNGHTFTRAWEGVSSLPVGPTLSFTHMSASGSSRVRNGDVYVEKDGFWS